MAIGGGAGGRRGVAGAAGVLAVRLFAVFTGCTVFDRAGACGVSAAEGFTRATLGGPFGCDFGFAESVRVFCFAESREEGFGL